MRKTICVFLLSIAQAQPAFGTGTDATGFDPTQVVVNAKGSSVPVGTIMAWPVAKNPDDMENWLECNGQSVSQSLYPELSALMSAVPDLRGQFLRGLGGNSAALGTKQGHAMRNIISSGSISTSYGGQLSGSGLFKQVGTQAILVAWGGGMFLEVPYYGLDLSAGGVPVANEVRPDNQAVRFLIRARP